MGNRLRVLRVPERRRGEKSLYLFRNRSERDRVSLNRYEQMLLDYVHAHPDETDYWKNQVGALRASHPGIRERVEELNRLLWTYFTERGRHIPALATVFTREGHARISMRNLAEYLIERWSPPGRNQAGSGLTPAP